MTAAEWGIPSLDLGLQATEVVAPVMKWGTKRRGTSAGTIHFYADDYHFTRLWYDPSKLVAAKPTVSVECNFSTHAEMTRVEALWNIYRKRFLAHVLQGVGVRIFVDLNVEPCFRDISLLGVPRGWNAYATRIHRGVPFATIEADHAQAAVHAGRPDPYFVVFGGGQRIQVACRERGWPWVPEHRQVVGGRYAADGTRIERSRDAGERSEGV